MSREEEAKLSSVLASRAPTVKEPFVFDKEDDKAKGDDTMSMVLMKRKMVTMSPILSVLLVMMS